MKLSGLIDALLASGGTVEQVRALVRAAEAEDEARRAAQRDGNAERQRRARAARLSRVTERDACDTPKKNGPPDPLRKTTPLETQTHTAGATSRMAPDWRPGAEGTAYAAEQGLSPAEIEAEAVAFRDHWLRIGEPQADWGAAWRGWVRNGLGRRKPAVASARAAPVSAAEPKVDLPIGRISERLVRETWAAGRWPKSWGPRRGEAGCRVPDRVFQVQLTRFESVLVKTPISAPRNNRVSAE